MRLRQVLVCCLFINFCATVPHIVNAEYNTTALAGISQEMVGTLYTNIDIETAPVQVVAAEEPEEFEEEIEVIDIPTLYDIPTYRGFKSYESVDALTHKSSRQYRLQEYCNTDEATGLRMYEGRYCVAIGTAFGVEVGQYFDIILVNDQVIPCIVGDVKASKDTDASNIFTKNGCATEFICKINKLDPYVRQRGDVSYYYDWNSPAATFVIYNRNAFDEIE